MQAVKFDSDEKVAPAVVAIDPTAERRMEEYVEGSPWQPPVLVRCMKRPTTPARRADVLQFSFCTPVVSRRVVDSVGPLLGAFGRLLPVTFEDVEFFAYDVKHVEDVLDLEHSSHVQLAAGKFIGHIQLLPAPPDAVFKLAGVANSPVFVGHSVAEHLRSKCFVGLDLGENNINPPFLRRKRDGGTQSERT